MRAFALWRPVVEAAAAGGASFYHVTLTQPTIEREGGAVTTEERRRGWKGELATAGAVLAPVAGEGLYAAHTRLRDSLKRFRASRKTRDVYYDALGGYLQAFEATGQSYRWDEGRKRKMGLGRPRWHVHTHILAMCPRGGREVDALRDLPRMWASHHRGWDAYGERWSTRADCQRIRRIEPERAAGDDALTHAVLEVLKYPFKTDTLTSAQLVEVLSVTKGMRFHQAAGGFYSRAGSGVPEPYASWLAARAAPTGYDRLYVVQRDVREDPGSSPERPILVDVNLEQAVFTGQPRYRAGWHWFRWGENGEPFAARGDQLSAILAGAEDVDPVVDDSDELVAVAA